MVTKTADQLAKQLRQAMLDKDKYLVKHLRLMLLRAIRRDKKNAKAT